MYVRSFTYVHTYLLLKKQGSQSRIKTGSAQGSLVKASMTEILEYFDTLRLPGIEL